MKNLHCNTRPNKEYFGHIATVVVHTWIVSNKTIIELTIEAEQKHVGCGSQHCVTMIGIQIFGFNIYCTSCYIIKYYLI